jgi:hypothetical protein
MMTMTKFKDIQIIIYAVFLLLLIPVQVFPQNSNIPAAWRRFSSDSVSVRLDEFLLYVGNQSEMAEMAANEFNMIGFKPYYGGDLPDPAGRSENY